MKIYEGENGAILISGPYVQVSRLGNPLFNEVLVPLSLKDMWNAQQPSGDKQFASYVSAPQLGTLLPGSSRRVPQPGRVQCDELAKGGPAGHPVDRDSFDRCSGFRRQLHRTDPADMLRLNMTIPPTPSTKFSNLGLIGGDVAGYPNGRRVQDDVARSSCVPSPAQRFLWWTPATSPTARPVGSPWG